eukprot:1835072-Prymnesium_polylepis.1
MPCGRETDGVQSRVIGDARRSPRNGAAGVSVAMRFAGGVSGASSYEPSPFSCWCSSSSNRPIVAARTRVRADNCAGQGRVALRRRLTKR